jgi:hypothetical protein
MCATIAAMAVQITRTQMATAMAAEITDIVSSLTFMILLPDGGDHQRRNSRSFGRQNQKGRPLAGGTGPFSASQCCRGAITSSLSSSPPSSTSSRMG